MNEKQSYYIDITTGEIMKDPYGWDWSFKVEATDNEIVLLRKMFDENYKTDWESFNRAHVPFLEYHHDPQNDEYDERMVYIYAMIYKLGDEKARNHIAEMGILNMPLRSEDRSEG